MHKSFIHPSACACPLVCFNFSPPFFFLLLSTALTRVFLSCVQTGLHLQINAWKASGVCECKLKSGLIKALIIWAPTADRLPPDQVRWWAGEELWLLNKINGSLDKHIHKYIKSRTVGRTLFGSLRGDFSRAPLTHFRDGPRRGWWNSTSTLSCAHIQARAHARTHTHEALWATSCS